MEFGKTFGAIAALEQKTPARRNFGQIGGQRARFTGKHQRWKARQRRFDRAQLVHVGIDRQMPRLVPRASYLHSSFLANCSPRFLILGSRSTADREREIVAQIAQMQRQAFHSQ